LAAAKDELASKQQAIEESENALQEADNDDDKAWDTVVLEPASVSYVFHLCAFAQPEYIVGLLGGSFKPVGK
jgi:hypothetical protein